MEFVRGEETMTLDHEEVKTREQMKKIRAQDRQPLTLRQRRKKVRVRLIPVWTKVTIVFLLLILSLLAGAVVGYGVIGNGDPSEALDTATWTHILDMINKNN